MLRVMCWLAIFGFLSACGGKGKTQVGDSTFYSSSSSSTSSSSSSSASSSTSSGIISLASKIDGYLVLNQSATSAGLIILIVKNNDVVYQANKGMADITRNTAISMRTGFNLASVSKPFTAIAIMQLVERGQLLLSDSVLKYIPELPAAWQAITIEHLLTHRSGIPDIINDGWRPRLLDGMTNYSLIDYLKLNPALEFQPGTSGDYSNTGYMLLANVIEKNSGLTFSSYMALNIFGPANMAGSYILDENTALKIDDALNYANLRKYYGIDTYFKGSSAQVSSAEDFLNFFQALRSGTIISAQTLDAMRQPRGNISYVGVANGYGFFIAGDSMMHAGQWDGFESDLMINHKSGLEWVILTNSGSAGRRHIEAIRQIIFSTDF